MFVAVCSSWFPKTKRRNKSLRYGKLNLHFQFSDILMWTTWVLDENFTASLLWETRGVTLCAAGAFERYRLSNYCHFFSISNTTACRQAVPLLGSRVASHVIWDLLRFEMRDWEEMSVCVVSKFLKYNNLRWPSSTLAHKLYVFQLRNSFRF